MLTRNMAMDYARDGIRVNVICPGGTITPRTRSYPDKNPGHEKTMEQLCPTKRFAQPEEIAKPAVFLASDDASYMTGAVLVVDGGMTAGIRFPLFDEMQSASEARLATSLGSRPLTKEIHQQAIEATTMFDLRPTPAASEHV